MERLFLSFHLQETLFMDGIAGRYRIRVERVGRATSGNGRVHLPIWGTRMLVFAQKPPSHERM